MYFEATTKKNVVPKNPPKSVPQIFEFQDRLPLKEDSFLVKSTLVKPIFLYIVIKSYLHD